MDMSKVEDKSIETRIDESFGEFCGACTKAYLTKTKGKIEGGAWNLLCSSEERDTARDKKECPKVTLVEA